MLILTTFRVANAKGRGIKNYFSAVRSIEPTPFSGKRHFVRCQIFEMSDFYMAYHEIGGRVLRYYIYNKYYLQYILIYYSSLGGKGLIENLTFLNLTILHFSIIPSPSYLIL